MMVWINPAIIDRKWVNHKWPNPKMLSYPSYKDKQCLRLIGVAWWCPPAYIAVQNLQNALAASAKLCFKWQAGVRWHKTWRVAPQTNPKFWFSSNHLSSNYLSLNHLVLAHQQNTPPQKKSWLCLANDVANIDVFGVHCCGMPPFLPRALSTTLSLLNWWITLVKCIF